ncbi:MAG: hypothetical protein RLZ98_3531 [Pseudomonadota bacterium]
MKRYSIFVGLIALATLLAGLYLVPQQAERATMLARDGRYEEALKLLDSLQARGGRRVDLLRQKSAVLLKMGEITRAMEAVSEYVRAEPDDLGALLIQADLYLHSGRLSDHLALLHRIVIGWPDRTRLAEILALYRLHGKHDAELELLKHFASSRMLSLSDRARLGGLHLSRQEWEEAARQLRIVDNNAKPDDKEPRLRLFRALVKSGQLPEAVRRAKHWLARWRSPYFAGKLLMQAGEFDEGAPLKDLVQYVVRTDPTSTFELVGVLTRAGQAGLARTMLKSWAENQHAPADQAIRQFIYASNENGDTEAPVVRLAQFVQSGVRPDIQVAFAEEIANAYGLQSISDLLPLLSREALGARPLLAARLAYFHDDAALALSHFDRVDPAVLNAARQEQWAMLLARLKPPRIVFDRLVALWRSGRMTPEVVAHLTRDATDPDFGSFSGFVELATRSDPALASRNRF